MNSRETAIAPQSAIDESFPRTWRAEILPARPLILPGRCFAYPMQAEEVEHGALEVMVYPATVGALPFLATCALGFSDPQLPTGVWSTPHPDWLCAIAGGYAYLVDSTAPEQCSMIAYRPVLQVLPVPAQNPAHAPCLLFVGHRSIVAWGAGGQLWESERLSDEGVTVTGIENGILRGQGWELHSDHETAFALDLRSGKLAR